MNETRINVLAVIAELDFMQTKSQLWLKRYLMKHMQIARISHRSVIRVRKRTHIRMFPSFLQDRANRVVIIIATLITECTNETEHDSKYYFSYLSCRSLVIENFPLQEGAAINNKVNRKYGSSMSVSYTGKWNAVITTQTEN